MMRYLWTLALLITGCDRLIDGKQSDVKPTTKMQPSAEAERFTKAAVAFIDEAEAVYRAIETKLLPTKDIKRQLDKARDAFVRVPTAPKGYAVFADQLKDVWASTELFSALLADRWPPSYSFLGEYQTNALKAFEAEVMGLVGASKKKASVLRQRLAR
jgi:hypothetical protein